MFFSMEGNMESKKIILASGSLQRKKLLRMLGVKFQVKPSQADELTKITTTCSSLVKANARLKAEAVAKTLKKGVVIGADTVVYAGNKKLIGKPKTFKEARAILKLLFSHPQWVYTGLSVIDVATGQQVLDYEKTQVFMVKLSDEEIDRYHQRVNPFDKAGGFDIEGWGSIFIHRIEGCYSNVIGLPMAKLALMLKKVGVSLLSLFLCVGFMGCSTEFNLATQQQETLIYTTDKEIRMGVNMAAKWNDHYDINTDVDVNARVEGLLAKIVAVSDRKDIVYFIKVIDDEEIVNAVSLPGGYIYIFKGLLEKVKDDTELAGVIAHEVAHITARHAVKRLQNAYGALLLQVASTQAGGNVAGGVGLALNTIFMEYSLHDEFESDRLAVKYLRKAGYDPRGVTGFLETLQDEHQQDKIRPFSYWRTHPNISQRIATANQEITGQLDFKDYLNLIGE